MNARADIDLVLPCYNPPSGWEERVATHFRKVERELLRPIREETERLLADKSYLESVYRAGAEKAAYVANRTLNKVYKKVGFLPR